MKTQFNTKNDLSKDTRKKVAALLNQTLADLSDLCSQTKQAHWNVRGAHFYSLHKLFEELANTIEAHVDPLAERIVTLGGVACGTVRQAAAQSSLEEFPTDKADDLGYVTALIERYAKLGKATRENIDKADELEDAGTADMFTALSQDLDKSLWFLEAHTRR